MFDTAGSRLNFPVVAGVEETFRVSFWVGGSGMSVLGATFQAACYVAHGDERGELVAVLPVKHDSAENKVLLTVPELEHGHYWWELRATDAAGKECRLLYGTLAALTSAEVARLGDAAEESELRELTVEIGGGYARPLILRWQACSVAASAAADAAKSAKDAREAVKRLESVEAAVQEFRVFMSAWKDDAASVLVMNPVTGTIWVGNTDTGQPYRGEDGQAPRINAYGFWEVLREGQWVTLPYSAIGKDGLDGTQVRRVLLGSRDELPTDEERGVFYYTPKVSGSGYDFWCWLENAGWVCFGGDPYGVATTTSLGLMCLGTGQPVADGAPVGLNEHKQAMVPLASTTVPGAMRPSSDVVSDVGGGTHFSVSGNLLCDVATVGSFGGVKLSTGAVLTAGGIIGVNADGQLLVRLATPEHAGAVLPGSKYGQLESIPYLLSVGVDGRGRLANCMVRGGALQHKQPKDWAGGWIESGAFPVDGAHYLGLVTSVQFTQSRNAGLELLPATTERLAGVYLAESGADERPAAVLPARLSLSRAEGYTKAEIDELFVSKAWHGDVREVYLTLSEYQALKVRDPKIAYNILED